jgi:hypothetical protein
LGAAATLVTFTAAFAATTAAAARPAWRPVDVGATIAARFLGTTVGFVTFAGVFAATGAGRPGLRPRAAGFVVVVVLAARAMVLNSCDS